MNDNERIRIYGKRIVNSYSVEMDSLKKETISLRNKELVKLFQDSLFSKGCGEQRVVKLSSQLRRICKILDKDLDKADKIDIERLLAYYGKKKDYAEITMSDYKRCLKQFYKWFEDEDKRLYNGNLEEMEKTKRFYKFVFNIKLNRDNKRRENKDIITEEDIDLVIKDGAVTFKDKAFLKLLHETGMRCSEILSVRIKDLILDGNIAKLRVPAMKTKERVIPLVYSLPYLHKLFEIHPFKENKESFIFIGDSRKHGKKPLTHDGAQKLVNRCFERVGLEKRHNLHWFRHSRASLLAPHLTEVLLCKYMGWVIGSQQVKTYVHLGENELEDAYCSLAGVKKVDMKKVNKELKKCVCGCMNESIAKYCYNCGQAIDISVILKEEEKSKLDVNNEFNEEMDKSIKLLIEIAKNPELMKKFEEFKKMV